MSIYNSHILYNKIKKGEWVHMGSSGVAEGVKVSEFDKNADFGPLYGGCSLRPR